MDRLDIVIATNEWAFYCKSCGVLKNYPDKEKMDEAIQNHINNHEAQAKLW